MEHTGCYSLSGYLSLKPVGALSLVLPTRRYWCAFNESIQTLEFYQSERDLITNKTAVESIPLYRAAITLSTTEERVFVILTNNKEYHLKADNHEALMIWLLGLQAKRDSCLSSNNGSSIHEINTGFDIDELINAEDVNPSDSLITSDILHSRMFITERSNLNDLSNEDEKFRHIPMNESIHRKMSTSSNTGGHLCSTCSLSLCSTCRSTVMRPSDLLKESIPNRTGSSSHSIESSDSAFFEQRLLDLNDGLNQPNNLQESLLALKCELAALLNKETMYQTIIKEKSEVIRKIEKQLADVMQSEVSCNKHQNISKMFNERSRQTNNELKFLHCEITRLHGVIRDDDMKLRKLAKFIRTQQIQRESLQRDYVYLLQTSLSSEDGHIFGGTKHRDRLKELLMDCRKRDPSLPSFDSMEGSGFYIDSYGFKHEKNNENDRLQYLCVKLTHFYDAKARSIDENVWRSLLRTFQSSTIVPTTLKSLVRQGIPNHLRSEVWHVFIQKQISHIRKIKGASYYENICHLLPNSDLNNKFEKQIALDLYRTMPSNIRFTNKDSDGIRHLRQVLQAFCLHNSSIGYCQGMNFIVAVALLLLEPDDAFWLLIAITECHLNNYYDTGLIGAQVDQFVLKDLLKQKAPDIHQHFELNEVEITSLTLNWFMAIFIDSVPFETLLRIWDCFLLEGAKVLFRFALAILIINRESILTKTDTISMMKQIKDSTKHLLDVETLFKIAFEDLKPFCHRKDISIKQAYWTKMLTDKVLKRNLSKEGFSNRDYVLQEINQSTTITLDCAAVLPGNIIWIAFGSQYTLRLYEVNVERGIMMDLGVTYNSRAFCMECVNNELVVVGTLCGTLLSFSIDERRILWATRLRSCLLCLTSLNKINSNRVYCGLSDGNLAIVELYDQHEPEEAFCITIDKSAITAVAYRNDKLWCLSSNKMTIVNEKTLDIVASIDLTFDNFNPTSLVYYDDDDSDHIWILLRSTSNILQVWNQVECRLYGTICLNNLFEKIGKTEEQLAMMEEVDHLGTIEDGSSSSIIDHIRITSFLVHDQQLWIGTSTGVIFVLNFSIQRKVIRTPSKTYPTTSTYAPRSLSVTSHMLNDATRNYLLTLSNFINLKKKLRSRSDSAMVDIFNSSDECWDMDGSSNNHLYQINFPNKTKDRLINLHRPRKRNYSTITYPTFENGKNGEIDSDDTSITLTSVKTQTSSPAVISSDEWCHKYQQIKFSNTNIKQHKALEPSATLSFNLLFKAKIADAPIKCICKTKCNDQFVILTCAGKLGDDEVVCRWKKVSDTNQWTNDVIVELSSETMLPIRPLYARQQYLKDHRDRSVSISSSTSKL